MGAVIVIYAKKCCVLCIQLERKLLRSVKVERPIRNIFPN